MAVFIQEQAQHKKKREKSPQVVSSTSKSPEEEVRKCWKIIEFSLFKSLVETYPYYNLLNFFMNSVYLSFIG